MKRKFISTALLVCFTIVCMAVIADLNGKWVGSLKIPDGNEIPIRYNFKVDGEKLTGTALSPEGEVNVEDGKIKGADFTFKVNVNGTDYPHTGKYYGDSVAMYIDFNGTKLHSTLKRADK